MKVAAVLERIPVNMDWVGDLQREWQGNARLRRGLLAIWGLFLLYLVLVLSDMAAERRDDLVQLEARLDRLLAIEAQQYWLDRAVRSKDSLELLQSRFPVVPNSGRAEAEVRSMLEAAVKATGTRKLRLSMKPAEAIQDGKLWRVTGSVFGVARGDTIRDFVANLETLISHSRFSRLKLVRGNTAEKVRVEVEIETFYRAPPQ